MFWYMQAAVCMHRGNIRKSFKDEAANIVPNIVPPE